MNSHLGAASWPSCIDDLISWKFVCLPLFSRITHFVDPSTEAGLWILTGVRLLGQVALMIWLVEILSVYLFSGITHFVDPNTQAGLWILTWVRLLGQVVLMIWLIEHLFVYLFSIITYFADPNTEAELWTLTEDRLLGQVVLMMWLVEHLSVYLYFLESHPLWTQTQKRNYEFSPGFGFLAKLYWWFD